MRIYSDKLLTWRPGRLYIPCSEFTGLIGTAGVATGANTGAPVTKEISTFGVVAVLMEADGDVIDHNMMLPYDVDLKRSIRFRVHWTSGSATTADTIDWKVFIAGFVPNVTTMIPAATALSTVIASDTVVGAYKYQTTEYGILVGSTLAQNVESVSLQVEMDTFAVGLSEDKFFLGLEMIYTPKRMRGPDGMAHGAALPTTALGSLY